MVRKLFAAALVLALLMVLPSAVSAASLSPNRVSDGDGTFTDPRTGLTWVADPSVAAYTLAEAVDLVQAMNAGRFESFGRVGWRVATASELASAPLAQQGPSRLAAERAGGHGQPSALRPVIGAAIVEGVAESVIIGVNSVHVDRDITVVGSVVANEASPGPTLDPPFELALGRNVNVTGDVRGDSVDLDRGVAISGNLAYNELTGNNFTAGSTTPSLSLPVFSMLPIFPTASPRDAVDLTVPAFGTETLSFDAANVVIGEGGTLVVTPGRHDVESIQGATGASIRYQGAGEVRVVGKMVMVESATIAPDAGSSAGAGDFIFYVGGINGTDGALGSLPSALTIGKTSAVQANLYAPNGTIDVEQGTAFTGALVGRDVLVKKDSSLTLASFFRNRAPSADPKTVSLDGANPILILLSGSDPDGDTLTFAIVSGPGSGPSHGSLGPITPIVPPPVEDRETGETTQPPTTQATVFYTPFDGSETPDFFVYSVSDPDGASGSATVSIVAPEDEAPPPPPDNVVADDVSDQTFVDTPVVLTLSGAAPDGVDLTFAIVAGSGPANGSLGPLTQGDESPQRTATVTYTPNSGFLGSDGFDFQACGTVAGALQCDTGSMSIEVVEVPTEPFELRDQTVATFNDQPVGIDLSGSGASSATGGSAAAAVAPLKRIDAAAVGIVGAQIAGNVADANEDGFGDNHNDLPGSVPVFISAGVDQVGGAGSNGTSRIHVEFPIAGMGSGDELVSATVTFHTNRGTTDSLDTFFWSLGDDGNGTLEDTDFERPAEQIAGVVMPVPVDQSPGEDGTFSFPALAQLRAALSAGFDYLTIQGRVDESLTGPARGLQVRSTASSNLSSFLEPSLTFATPPPTAPSVFYRITSLPLNGTLRDASGTLITAVPTDVIDPNVTYEPAGGFSGSDGFTYEARNFFDSTLLDSATITLVVQIGSCADSELFCDDGR